MTRRTSRKKTSSARQSIRDKARGAAEKRERGGGGLDTLQNIPQDVEFFKPKMGRGKKGQNRISIVPYVISIDNHPFQEPGELWPECTYWQHKIGFGTDSKRFICLTKTEQNKSKKCPICEYRKALLDSGSDPDLAEELKPKQRQLFNVLDHDNEDKGIQLLEMSPYMFGHMLDDEDKAQAEDFEDKYYGDFENGLMVVARFNEASFGGNKFAECARIDFEERDDLAEELVLEEAVDLDASLRILDYDELNMKFHEIDNDEDDGEGDEEEEDDNSSRKKRTRTKSTRRKKEEDQEDEDESDEGDEDESDEEEEEKKPAKTSKRRTTKKAPAKKKSEPECPFEYEFGTDCDSYDECDECDIWEDCRDRLDEIESK